MKTLFVTTLFFGSTAMYAQSEASFCDCEEVTSEQHCALILCGSMEGTVTQGTSPISCACVKVYSGAELIYATKTAADGTYAIPNLIMGTFDVKIIHDGTEYDADEIVPVHDSATILNLDLDDLPAQPVTSTSK